MSKTGRGPWRWQGDDRENIKRFGCTQEELDANRLPWTVMF